MNNDVINIQFNCGAHETTQYWYGKIFGNRQVLQLSQEEHLTIEKLLKMWWKPWNDGSFQIQVFDYTQISYPW